MFNHEDGLTETSRFFSRTRDELHTRTMHPNNDEFYMCEEKGNKVLYFRFDEESGKMEALQELSTVPETVTGYSDASEAMIDPSGKFVIADRDRQHAYRIDPLTGYLKTSDSILVLERHQDSSALVKMKNAMWQMKTVIR